MSLGDGVCPVGVNGSCEAKEVHFVIMEEILTQSTCLGITGKVPAVSSWTFGFAFCVIVYSSIIGQDQGLFNQIPAAWLLLHFSFFISASPMTDSDLSVGGNHWVILGLALSDAVASSAMVFLYTSHLPELDIHRVLLTEAQVEASMMVLQVDQCVREQALRKSAVYNVIPLGPPIERKEGYREDPRVLLFIFPRSDCFIVVRTWVMVPWKYPWTGRWQPSSIVGDSCSITLSHWDVLFSFSEYHDYLLCNSPQHGHLLFSRSTLDSRFRILNLVAYEHAGLLPPWDHDSFGSDIYAGSAHQMLGNSSCLGLTLAYQHYLHQPVTWNISDEDVNGLHQWYTLCCVHNNSLILEGVVTISRCTRFIPFMAYLGELIGIIYWVRAVVCTW